MAYSRSTQISDRFSVRVIHLGISACHGTQFYAHDACLVPSSSLLDSRACVGVHCRHTLGAMHAFGAAHTKAVVWWLALLCCQLCTCWTVQAHAPAPAAAPVGTGNSDGAPQSLASLVPLAFDWTDAPADAIDNFLPDSCRISGVKSYRGEYFLTIPRFHAGVPATLTKLGEYATR